MAAIMRTGCSGPEISLALLLDGGSCGMQVVIANNVYQEGLFADIEYKDTYWAQVRYDEQREGFNLTIGCGLPTITNAEGDYVFDLAEVQEALERAKQRLIDLGIGKAD
jgi:hypothetical protein